MSSQHQSAPGNYLPLFAVLFVLGVGGVIPLLYIRSPTPPSKPTLVDPLAAMQANNRGVGLMEQYEYDKAVKEFEEVVRLDPSWAPGQINLGIALLNSGAGDSRAKAKALFQKFLTNEPNNPYAHYCLGIIYEDAGDSEKANKQFETVTKLDPQDAQALFRFGKTLPDGADKIAPLRRAHELNPYLSGAIYNLAMELRATDLKQAQALLAHHTQLGEVHNWDQPTRLRYGEMGKYAEVIGARTVAPSDPILGPLPLFSSLEPTRVALKEGTRWAGDADLPADELASLRKALRARFGGALVVLDYDGDGKPDVFLIGAVLEKNRLRNLLLHNVGAGAFEDVTEKAGLAGDYPAIGCTVADYDNDGLPDLLLTGVGGVRLHRNAGKGSFEDVTAKAGLDSVKGVTLGSVFVDLDQDSDLDLVMAEYAATPPEAAELLAGNEAKPTGRLVVFLNAGEAPPVKGLAEAPPLSTRFQRADGPPSLLGSLASVVAVATGDLDDDLDMDLLVLADGQSPEQVLNDRLLRFHRESLTQGLGEKLRWNGALFLDSKRAGQSDLFLVPANQQPILLRRSERPGGPRDIVVFPSPRLKQALAIDLDYDGWIDIVGLGQDGKPVLLHNRGGQPTHVAEALGSDKEWPKDLLAVAVSDFAGGRYLDLLTWSAAGGLRLHRNQGNGNHAIRVGLLGRKGVEPAGGTVRCNRDGVGTRLVAHVGEHRATAAVVTQSAGLGQSRLPIVLGLGKQTRADVVRLRWPDNCWQAEFDIPADALSQVRESNRQKDSCPVLFTWNGRRFEFITDFLGAGSVGESLAGGGFRPPRPEESVKIEAGQLLPRDGKYTLKVGNPMNETDYIDHLQLIAVDHPPNTQVFPDERFGGLPATQEILRLGAPIPPRRAVDHRGQDITSVLCHWDRATVSDYARRSWLGFAEEHSMELNFGDLLTKATDKDRFVLCLAGWVEYPYPESIWAAGQAGVAMLPPVLERKRADGSWEVLVEDAGFPAGLPRMTTLELPAKVAGPHCTLRLRTNLAVHWDQAYLAPRLPASEGQKVRETTLEPIAATLASPGCAQEFTPDGKLPGIYDADRLDRIPVVRQKGYVTKLGDVVELLTATDDRFAVMGPGDEVTVDYDAKSLPPLPDGWTRSFVLRTWGYCKDAAPFTASWETIGPLPFRSMKSYPYGAEQKHPHPDYERTWNTRRN